jgi:hypothetical protein
MVIAAADGSYHHGSPLIGNWQSRHRNVIGVIQLSFCFAAARTASSQFFANDRAESMSRIIRECSGTSTR